MNKMKTFTTLLILVILIGFVSCDTLTRYTIRVPVDRAPVLTIVNQTGSPVAVTAPVSVNLAQGARNQHQPVVTSGTINVTYSIGRFQFTEQVTMANADATVTLTRSPPWLTVVNNTGATVTTIFVRNPGAPSWHGGTIFVHGGRAIIRDGGAILGDISESIINGDSMNVFLGELPIINVGAHLDVRIDDVQGRTFVRSNVPVTADISLTFTPADIP